MKWQVFHLCIERRDVSYPILCNKKVLVWSDATVRSIFLYPFDNMVTIQREQPAVSHKRMKSHVHSIMEHLCGPLCNNSNNNNKNKRMFTSAQIYFPP